MYFTFFKNCGYIFNLIFRSLLLTMKIIFCVVQNEDRKQAGYCSIIYHSTVSTHLRDNLGTINILQLLSLNKQRAQTYSSSTQVVIQTLFTPAK